LSFFGIPGGVSWSIHRTIGSCPDPTWRTVCQNAVDSKQTAWYNLMQQRVLNTARHFIAAAATKTNTAGFSWLRIDVTVFLQSRSTMLIRGMWAGFNCA
jgi:hypothetical protein